MRQFTVGLLAGSILLSTACSKNPGENAPSTEGARSAAAQDYFTVRAGPVANAKIDALAGTFQMLKVGQGNGIPSSGLGGACLIFDAADLGYRKMAGVQCQTNQQCYTKEGESAAYCDGKTHSCWARPGSDATGAKTCNRPLKMTADVINSAPAQPVDVAPLGVKAGTKVRVVACLNKGSPPPPPPAPPCGLPDSLDRIEVMGPAANIHS